MAVEAEGTNGTGNPGEEQGVVARILDSDLLHSFLRNRLVVVAAIVTLAFVLVSLLAPWIAPHDPYDVRTLNLLDSHTRQLGRRAIPDSCSARTTKAAIFSPRYCSEHAAPLPWDLVVLLAVAIGVSRPVAGYFGGPIDTVIMRIADVQLTFPAILTALLIDGVARAFRGAR